MRVKICGIRALAEAEMAADCGADAVGFLIGQRHAASDFIEPSLAAEICRALPPFLTTVLVTHLEDPAAVLALAEKVPCTTVQLHSDLSPEVILALRQRLFPRMVIGKVSVKDQTALARASDLQSVVHAILLDSIDPSTNRVGGTGLVHDWRISAQIACASRKPIILAGGLRPDNVAQAIAAVKPFAVDVNSGVETSDGAKSEERVRKFISAAKAVQGSGQGGD